MSESIKKSLNNLTQTIKSNNYKNSQASILSPYEFKPKKQLNTLINTPVNTLVSKSLLENSLSNKFSKNNSNTLQKLSSFFNIRNILFIILLIFLLAFFGLNIFTYLSDGTNLITKLLGPIFSTTGEVIGDTTKNIVSYGSSGIQKIIKTGSNTSENIVDVATKGSISSIGFLQNQLKKTGSVINPENNNILTNDINKKINNTDSEPEPIRTESLKGGYCFIGKINDTRYCAKVNARQECLSGDIYPSMDICVNPKLRR